jgi:hypothetical protein
VKVLNVEGIANRDVSESCALAGNFPGEALTGVRAGQVLSRESVSLRGADAVGEGGRQHRSHRYREVHPDPARSETLSMYGGTMYGNREIPHPPRCDGTAGRIGKSKDARR